MKNSVHTKPLANPTPVSLWPPPRRRIPKPSTPPTLVVGASKQDPLPSTYAATGWTADGRRILTRKQTLFPVRPDGSMAFRHRLLWLILLGNDFESWKALGIIVAILGAPLWIAIIAILINGLATQ